MNSQDMNSLIEDALSVNAASGAFKERVLRDSTVAFTRGMVLKTRLRTAGFTSLTLLVAAAAFFCGRLSAPGEVGDRQVVVQSVDGQNDNVSVSRDLVAWLDAARFFTQLGMEERAALSYKRASELIPYDVPANQQAGLESQNMLADVSSDRDDEILGKISAQNFGG
ncbi:MAG: hypothetical protein PVJ86_06255 [Phycisphaerales bacterium]|jgi:hypothetical protein